MKSNIARRLPGGIMFVWRKKINFLEKNAFFDNYAKYWNEVFFFGGKNVNYKKYLMTEAYFEIGNLKIPALKNKSEIKTFMMEFADLLLPYLVDAYSFDYHMIEDRFVEGPYEIDENVSLNKDDVVIDCGANMGLFSLVSLAKGCKVYAFEPSTYMIKNFLEKIEIDNKEHFFIEKYALVNETNKKIEMTDPTGGNLGNSHMVNIDRKQKEVEDDNRINYEKKENVTFVEGISLDDWVERNNITKIDFIKADIEGAERLLLKGATNVLKNLHPKLAICTYHFKDDPEILEDIIKKANPNYVIRHRYLKLYAYVPLDMEQQNQ